MNRFVYQRRYLHRRVVAFAVCFFSVSSHGHPDDEWAAQFQALSLWAAAVTAVDSDAVAALTASGSRVFVGSVDTVVSARYATFSPTDSPAGEGVVASPVVLSTDLGTFTTAWSVLLTQESGAWKVKTISPGAELPVAFNKGKLPEHVVTAPVAFSLQDANSGKPVYARVRITDESGDYWPPDGHQKTIRTGWRQDVGGDVLVDSKTYAYVGPEFVARLPDGEFTIEVRKGTEYLPTRKSFEVAGGSAPDAPVSVAIDRWINMKSRGWYAGDTHTHFLDDRSGMLELRAEDLSVLYILATKWGELITDVNRFSGGPSAVSTKDEIVVYNEETRHVWLGHTILHGIEELVYPLTWGGPGEGVVGGYDYPAMAYQADQAHEQNALVTWAHFPLPDGELAVDIALDKIDTVDLFTWGDAFAPGPVLPGGIQLPSAVEVWYQFLNTNSRLPATAGTDKMLNVQVSGSVRTYAHTGDDFSYQQWLDALAGGRTMVSTGPVVTMTANGRPIGSELDLEPGAKVDIRAELVSPFEHYPVEVLEIVVGGEVVASTSNEDERSELVAETTVEPGRSTWVAARARGSVLLPYQVWSLLNAAGIPPMAHTSPIYLSVADRPIWVAEDAAALERRVDVAIAWAENQGRYRSDSQRQEMIELFNRAKAYYASGPSR